MKQKLLIGILFVAAILGYLASPYISVYGLFAAIKSGDTYALKRHINFPELKSSLKDEIKSKLLKSVKDSVKENGGNDTASEIGLGFAALLGPAVVDSAVDAIVTPSGLSAFISDPKNAINSTDEKDTAEKTDSSTLLNWSNVEYAFFTGLTEFEIRTDTDVTLHFSLNGTSWKLDGLTLPDKATRKKRLSKIGNSKLILGCWKFDYNGQTSKTMKIFFDFKNNEDFTIIKTYNDLPTTLEEGKYTLKNQSLLIDVKSEENIIYRDLVLSDIDKESMILSNKNREMIFKKASPREMGDLKLTNKETVKEYKDNLSRNKIISDVKCLMLALNEGILERIASDTNLSNYTILSKDGVAIGFPYDSKISTKISYIESIKSIPEEYMPNSKKDKCISAITRYFDIANTSWDDDKDTPFLISNDCIDSPFSGKKCIIPRLGSIYYSDSSQDLKSKLPNRYPAILPEN